MSEFNRVPFLTKVWSRRIMRHTVRIVAVDASPILVSNIDLPVDNLAEGLGY